MVLIDCLNAPRLPGQQTRQGFQLFIISQLLLPILNPRFQTIRRARSRPEIIRPDKTHRCNADLRHQIEASHVRTKRLLQNLHHTIYETVLIDTAEPQIH